MTDAEKVERLRAAMLTLMGFQMEELPGLERELKKLADAGVETAKIAMSAIAALKETA